MHDMSIEQDLLRSCACHKVRMAARAVTRSYDEMLRPTGLRATQVALLVAVATGQASSIAALAQVGVHLGIRERPQQSHLLPAVP